MFGYLETGAERVHTPVGYFIPILFRWNLTLRPTDRYLFQRKIPQNKEELFEMNVDPLRDSPGRKMLDMSSSSFIDSGSQRKLLRLNSGMILGSENSLRNIVSSPIKLNRAFSSIRSEGSLHEISSGGSQLSPLKRQSTSFLNGMGMSLLR